ncbi:MAG TPA: carboxypeptidase regulatory-like domain-containing protein [Bryobacteraceae bacterium]|nr:carboxypeptidase regulatory-like domain-containing protein [Bryobacteraceae bacterium]
MLRTTARVSLALIALLFAACAWAQEGSITGTVKDASGAAVPGATVSVTSVEQGFVRTTTTNPTGDYLVSGLLAGHYNINVTAQGFKQYVVKDLILRVADKARADAALEVGQVSTELTVAGANVAQVQTESAELSGVITNKQIDQLVLNGRNFTQLVTLIPGVSNQTGQDEGTVGVYGSVAYSVNGGRTEYNNWELDGGDNMDNGSNTTLNAYPNVDAVAEVKVLTSNYGAQYGRNGSATIETITKSGTRDFHGDLFEFVRNDDFNARNFFQSTVPEYKKNDYGYTIGGPVFIPKVYNRNRDKTFFFFSEEWRKELVPGQTFNQQVPSTQERSGNFSDVCPASGSSVNTTNFPNCPVNPSTGAYFPGNQVPVTPQAQAMLPLISAPNFGSGATSFFNAAPAEDTNWREELARVDENFNDKVRFFYRFIHDSWNTVTPTPLWSAQTGSFPTVETSFVGPGVSMVANLTVSASPTLLNEFVFSYTTDHILLNAIGSVQRPASFDMPGIFNNGFRGLLPNIYIENTAEYGGGFNAPTGYFPWNNANPTFTYKDNVTKIWGTHNLTFGAYFVAAQKNEDNSNFQDAQGSLTFNGTAAGSTGNGFADFLIGDIYSFDQTNLVTKYYNRYKILEPYIQDDWHATRKLTLNLGLRVSLFGTYREKYKQAYNFDPSAYNPADAPIYGPNGLISGNPFDGIVQCGVGGVPRGCMVGHLFNPAPRVGFAYDPTGDGKTAIRGGYGIFFEHTNGNEGNTESLEGSPPLVQNITEYNLPTYTSIFSTSSVSGPLNVLSIPTKAIWPYVQQWNFSIQRELPSHIILTTAYVGSKGTHLTDVRDLNQVPPVSASQNPYLPGQPISISGSDCMTGTVNGAPVVGPAANNLAIACGADPAPYRPYLGFEDITGLEDQANSNYNALQVSARRNFSHLTLSLAYSWSHSIDDSSDRGDSTFVNSYNLESARASSNFDQRHLLNVSWVYDVPFFTKSGFLHAAFGGWQWSGLMTYQSGTPFTVVNGLYSDNAGVGNGLGAGSYVNIVGNPNAPPPTSNIAGILGPLLYNPYAFGDPTGLTFGDAGRNILNSPARTNFDMGLFKHFPLHSEQRALEFRAEAFNVFNHTQWLPMNTNGVSSSNVDAACYGGPNNVAQYPATCAANDFLIPPGAHNPRILQLGMKFIF